VSVTRRRARRLTRTLLAVVVTVGLIHAVSAHGDDDRAKSRAAATKPSVGTPKSLFAGQLIVEGIHGFSTAEVRRIQAAAGSAPLVVTDGEVYLMHGGGAYPELPVATMVASATAYGNAANVDKLAGWLSRGAVLATSAAQLFHMAVGDSVQVAHGPRLRITAVVDDKVLAGYQMAVGSNIPVGLGSHADYVIVNASNRVAAIESAVHRALPDRRLRFTLPSPKQFFSPNGDVLSQSQLDERFGLFYVRETKNGIQLDPRWVSAYIRTPRIVQLGLVECNRGIVGPLTAAMKQITRLGLGKIINTADFIYEGGCWNPRTVRFGHGMISHHAWGVAIDINVGRNPLGAVPHQDSRLVAIMAKYGFTWGGTWLRHDGAHFEWIGTGASS
jgi:hypothetical protein